MSLLGACTERSNEHVSSDDHQVSIAGGARARVESTMSHVWEGARVGSYHVSCLAGGTGAEPGGGSMYTEVQCTMGNGHMGHSCGQTEWQTHMTENIAFPQLHWWLLSRCSGKQKSQLLSLAWYLFSVEKGSRYLPSSSNVFISGWLYLW